MVNFVLPFYCHSMHYLAWKERSRRTMFENNLFRLVLSDQESADGKSGTFTLLECPDWATVIALTQTADGSPGLLLVRQYRVGAKTLSLEFPGGAVEPGEEDQAAARRELLEETGYIADEWIKLGAINPNASFMTNRAHTWLARGLHRAGDQQLDPQEIIDLQTVAIADIEAGKHPEFEVNAIMMVSWYWFKRWQSQGQ